MTDIGMHRVLFPREVINKQISTSNDSSIFSGVSANFSENPIETLNSVDFKDLPSRMVANGNVSNVAEKISNVLNSLLSKIKNVISNAFKKILPEKAYNSLSNFITKVEKFLSPFISIIKKLTIPAIAIGITVALSSLPPIWGFALLALSVAFLPKICDFFKKINEKQNQDQELQQPTVSTQETVTEENLHEIKTSDS